MLHKALWWPHVQTEEYELRAEAARGRVSTMTEQVAQPAICSVFVTMHWSNAATGTTVGPHCPPMSAITMLAALGLKRTWSSSQQMGCGSFCPIRRSVRTKGIQTRVFADDVRSSTLTLHALERRRWSS